VSIIFRTFFIGSQSGHYLSHTYPLKGVKSYRTIRPRLRSPLAPVGVVLAAASYSNNRPCSTLFPQYAATGPPSASGHSGRRGNCPPPASAGESAYRSPPADYSCRCAGGVHAGNHDNSASHRSPHEPSRRP